MNIGFLLNGKSVSMNVPPERRAIDILRENFSLLSVRGTCNQASCGRCTILLNGEAALACLIPAFALKGASVMTIEGLQKSREYQDVKRGFREADYHPCVSCEAARIIRVCALLDKNLSPSPEEILASIQGIECRCADWDAFISGVTRAAGHIRRRKRARKR